MAKEERKIALDGLDRQIIKIQLTGSLQLPPSLQIKIFYRVLSSVCVTHSWCTHVEVLSDFPLSGCLCASGWVWVQEVTGHSTPLSSHPLSFLWTLRFSTFGEEGKSIPHEGIASCLQLQAGPVVWIQAWPFQKLQWTQEEQRHEKHLMSVF